LLGRQIAHRVFRSGARREATAGYQQDNRDPMQHIFRKLAG
jgi:hypothetical protein